MDDRAGHPNLKTRGTALKGGSIGEPDDWLGIYDRSINPGFRFPFEWLNLGNEDSTWCYPTLEARKSAN
jgi:hypothetical protein